MSQRSLLVSAASLALSLLLCSCHDRDECCEPCPRAAPPAQAACSGNVPQVATGNNQTQLSADLAREVAQLRAMINAESSRQPAPQREARLFGPSMFEIWRISPPRGRKDELDADSLIKGWKWNPPTKKSKILERKLEDSESKIHLGDANGLRREKFNLENMGVGLPRF
ncbi:MAG TPA: hypothetical protein VKX17_28260 [Planctomycetota bacterium]|nr:hypothetical protein [Planctomycetota bacterium]